MVDTRIFQCGTTEVDVPLINIVGFQIDFMIGSTRKYNTINAMQQYIGKVHHIYSYLSFLSFESRLFLHLLVLTFQSQI